MSATDSRPVSELFADALKQLSKLMRNELQLARAEIAVKASEAMSAVGLVVVRRHLPGPCTRAAPDGAGGLDRRAWHKILNCPPYGRRRGLGDRRDISRHRLEPAKDQPARPKEDP
jgi:hypothetical protein